MADIAFIFGWGPAQLDDLELPDLMRWRGLAIDRWNRTNGGKEA